MWCWRRRFHLNHRHHLQTMAQIQTAWTERQSWFPPSSTCSSGVWSWRPFDDHSKDLIVKCTHQRNVFLTHTCQELREDEYFWWQVTNPNGIRRIRIINRLTAVIVFSEPSMDSQEPEQVAWYNHHEEIVDNHEPSDFKWIPILHDLWTDHFDDCHIC